MNARQLQRHIRHRQLLRVSLGTSTTENFLGIPVGFSDTFWLIHQLREFHLDGFIVIPTWNITAIRSGPYERAGDRILKGEGIDRQAGLSFPLRLNSAEELFTDLRAAASTVSIQKSVHVKRSKPKEEIFLIGTITEVQKNSMSLLSFDACGRVDLTAESILYDDIARAEFGTEYGDVWMKYLRPPARRRSSR
jgi:hypothetical protein